MSELTDGFKQQAGEAALAYVQSGMTLGLGTGSTAIWALRGLGRMLAEGRLRDIRGVPTSSRTEAEARRMGIPLVSLEEVSTLDVTIDGADEVAPNFDVIKGGGGALLREKIVAQASHLLIIAADESKLVPALGTGWAIPVEVVPFGWSGQAKFIEALGGQPVLRLDSEGRPYRTDHGNYILDSRFPPLAEAGSAAALGAALKARTGIVEHGLFLGLTGRVIVAGPGGVRDLPRTAMGSMVGGDAPGNP